MDRDTDERTNQNLSESPYLRKWPERNEYFSKRDAFVEKQKKAVEKQLLEVGYSPDQVGDMAVVVARGSYLFDLMRRILKVDSKVATKLVWSPDKVGKKTRGQTSFLIEVEDKQSESMKSALEAAKEDKDVVLKKAEIVVNLGEINGVVNRLIEYERIGGDLFKRGELEEGAGPQVRKEGLEELGIKTEMCIVEEVAHILYVDSMFKGKSRLITWLQSMQSYSPPSDEEPILKIDTEEEVKLKKENYYDTEIEKRARILMKLFLEKYYPSFED